MLKFKKNQSSGTTDHKNKNTWGAKFKRTCTSILPVSKDRTGRCLNCGECCKLPVACLFLKYNANGKSYCAVHSWRSLNCRKYPRTESELLTEDTCGFSFD